MAVTTDFVNVNNAITSGDSVLNECLGMWLDMSSIR